jgi:YidC/Oxa1 family membrane protein insertase
MDRKSVIVLVVCAALFFAWPKLMERMYPPKPFPRTNTTALVSNTHPADTNVAVPTLTATTNAPAFIAPKPDAPEDLLVVSNATSRVTFTSHGGGIKEVELLKYPESVGCGRKQAPTTHRVATLNHQAQQPVLALSGGDLTGDGVYKLSKTQPPPSGTNRPAAVEVVRAEKLLSNGLYVVKDFEVLSNYLVRAQVRFENRSGKALLVPAQQWVAGTATPLNPQDDEQMVGMMWYDGSRSRGADNNYFLNRTLGCFPGTPRIDYRASGGPVVWTSAHNQFFFVGLMPKVPGTEVLATRFTLPSPGADEIAAAPKTITNQFAIQVLMTQTETNLAEGLAFEREFLIYAGPKEYRILERIGADMKNNLDSVMSFGWFGFFSKFLLLSMNGLHALGLSYGLAIIAITVIIKSLFWPLTAASTRSMKRMQALQPQMKAIQEKFKDDPAKMNKKMMEFMRENKVSPLGGCLPLVLQIPVFIGFFQMVRTAIELRGAKFLWACDLSTSDTIFVIPGFGFPVNPLPLLMGLTMFWQARLTPPSPGMDPMQQKIMKYFPLIFLFMLYNYSAGLTLYWTVQNLLSIAQMKLTKTIQAQPATPAKAPAPVAPRKKKDK